jgi:hypothetical protein
MGYIAQVCLSADWSKGLNFSGLPLVIKRMLEKLMNGEGS